MGRAASAPAAPTASRPRRALGPTASAYDMSRTRVSVKRRSPAAPVRLRRAHALGQLPRHRHGVLDVRARVRRRPEITVVFGAQHRISQSLDARGIGRGDHVLRGRPAGRRADGRRGPPRQPSARPSGPLSSPTRSDRRRMPPARPPPPDPRRRRRGVRCLAVQPRSHRRDQLAVLFQAHPARHARVVDDHRDGGVGRAGRGHVGDVVQRRSASSSDRSTRMTQAI